MFKPVADKWDYAQRQDSGASRKMVRRVVICGGLTAVIGSLTCAAITSMDLLSAARGYTQAEALWSKGQKDAVLALTRYAQTRSEADYERFRAAIHVPFASREARRQMDLPQPDPVVLNRAYAEVGIDEKDRSGMVWLYRYFGWVPEPARAIAIWAEAERGIEALERNGERLHELVLSDTPDRNAITEALAENERINCELTPLEARFSQAVADAGHWLHGWLRAIISIVAALMIVAGWMTLHMLLRAQELRGEIASHLEFQATHDGLTGLLNRHAFGEALSGAVRNAGATGSGVVLMYLDLDGFKFVNDSLGHGTGDLLLPAVAARLSACLPPSATLCRVGGDEFTVILPQAADRPRDAAFAERLLTSLEAPFLVKDYELFVSASIGICGFPEDGADSATLVQHADAAMYQAKRGGPGRYCFFTGEMASAATARLELERDLRHALDRGELEVYFQPLVAPPDSSLVGFEALCRWRHTPGTYIPPDLFIPVAEDTGLIIPIGRWVIEQACRQARDWNKHSAAPIRVAANVSVVQLAQSSFAREVADILEQTDLPAHLLELEVTESAVTQNSENATRMLRELRELGVSIALDDFGTGYSSLSRLRLMPLDALKIDRAFVHDLAQTHASRQLMASLISLAHGIGLRVVGEGVESPEQAEILRSMGCDLLQGFLFSKPMNRGDACRLVRFAGDNAAAADLAALSRAVEDETVLRSRELRGVLA